MDHADKANVILAWTAHPARAHLGRAIAALVVVALVGMGVALTAGDWLPGLLGGMLLLASMQRFFFPSSFAIDEEGITAKHLLTSKRLLWRDVRRIASDAHGGYLSTRATPNWTDTYRGVHVVFGDEREQAVAAIHAQMRKREESHGKPQPAVAVRRTDDGTERTAGSPA